MGAAVQLADQPCGAFFLHSPLLLLLLPAAAAAGSRTIGILLWPEDTHPQELAALAEINEWHKHLVTQAAAYHPPPPPDTHKMQRSTVVMIKRAGVVL